MRLQDIRYAVVALALLVAPACGRVGDNTSAVNQRDTAATERAGHQANDGAPDTRDTDASRRDERSTGTAGSIARSPEEAMGVGPDGAITMKIQAKYADDNVVRGNVFVATAQNLLLLSDAGNNGTQLDWNLWYAPGGAAVARFVWNGTEHAGFASYLAATGQDAHSLFADPLLANPATGDVHLTGG